MLCGTDGPATFLIIGKGPDREAMEAFVTRQALAAARRQNLDQAVEIWDKVLTIYPEFEAARLKRSEALRRKKMLEQIPRAN